MKWQDILKYDDIPAMFEDLRREIVEFFPPRYIGNIRTPNSILRLIFLLTNYTGNPEYLEERTQALLKSLLNKISEALGQFSDDEGHDEAFEDSNTLFYTTAGGLIDKISEALTVREEYT